MPSTSTVNISLGDIFAAPVGGVTCVFMPQNTPVVDNGTLVVSAPRRVVTAANGTATVTLEQGYYTLTFVGIPDNFDEFLVGVPGSGTYNLTQLINAGINPATPVNPGTGAWINFATGINWRGGYSNTTQYAATDAVYYQGSSYVMVSSSPVTGKNPVSYPQYWSTLALAGAAGATGATGIAGQKGATGDPGLNWRGDYGEFVDYAPRDAVAYQGSSYVRVGNTTISGITPSASSPYWDLLAAAGSGSGGGSGGGGTANLTVSSNTGLAYNSSTGVLNTTYNTTLGDSLVSVAVGGAPAQAASVWKTKNVVQVLDAILFPDLAPTYTPLSSSLYVAGEYGLFETGSTFTQSVQASLYKNDSGSCSKIVMTRSGVGAVATFNNPSSSSTADVPDQFGYPNPNTPNKYYGVSYSDSVVLPDGQTYWELYASLSAGLPKKNNKGVTDTRTSVFGSANAPQAAVTDFALTSVSVYATYPYFWGVSDTALTASQIATLIATSSSYSSPVKVNKVVNYSNGSVPITFNASNQYVWFACPAFNADKTSWYNTALNNGGIGSGNFILSPETQNVNSDLGYWSGISYKVYRSGYASTTSGVIEFRE